MYLFHVHPYAQKDEPILVSRAKVEGGGTLRAGCVWAETKASDEEGGGLDVGEGGGHSCR